ncbi:hypothetical protein F0P96_18000 [Hymenobacter busanensis]|uniref:Uncharacterized protein n=1 Tax=Hymenobacter busanensis TaxID=2607656 RepID=A0A7L4ZSQ9_9BACT|nr:hypothetical protein [Hymenobacter busanensis]KAA9327131.1 hypothetical protein F0P96_18000 [Hymenobacter busanensis]QHJ05796.1 hypothetical protein GUY19_00200 [Hymenobacter busanensis]
MAEQPANGAEQQEDFQAMTRPGSQSSSGMSTQTDDSLLDALQREQQAQGQQPIVPAIEAQATNSAQAESSPLGRNPEATTGPVTD